MLEAGKYSWECTICGASGTGGASKFAVHYRVQHQEPEPSYTGYLIEARDEHGLRGTAAYQWAHAAYAEYVRNQQ